MGSGLGWFGRVGLDAFPDLLTRQARAGFGLLGRQRQPCDQTRVEAEHVLEQALPGLVNRSQVVVRGDVLDEGFLR